jgi:hypothetical protein
MRLGTFPAEATKAQGTSKATPVFVKASKAGPNPCGVAPAGRSNGIVAARPSHASYRDSVKWLSLA